MEEKENLFAAEAEEETTEEVVEEATEEAIEDEAVEAIGDELEAPAEIVQKSQKSKSGNFGILIAAMFAVSIVVSVLVSFLALHFAPAIKFNKAMKLIEKGELAEAYTALDTIDEEYPKAKYELNKFVKFPEETSVVQGGGQAEVSATKVTTKKNYYKVEESMKDPMTGEDVTQTQEVYFDANGNKIKEVYKMTGVEQTVVRTFDKNGNTLTEKVTVVSTDKENPVDYSQYNTETTNKNMKYYYVGK